MAGLPSITIPPRSVSVTLSVGVSKTTSLPASPARAGVPLSSWPSESVAINMIKY